MTPTESTALAADPPAPASAGPIVDPMSAPTLEGCADEYARYFADRDAKRITVGACPAGHHVAYYAGRIHDHAADPTALRVRAAAALRVHPARIVVDYPWAW